MYTFWYPSSEIIDLRYKQANVFTLVTLPVLLQAQRDHDAAKAKLASLEKKILVGGENLLEKAEEQEKLLEDSARQLEETVRNEAAIRKALKGLVTNTTFFCFSLLHNKIFHILSLFTIDSVPEPSKVAPDGCLVCL